MFKLSEARNVLAAEGMPVERPRPDVEFAKDEAFALGVLNNSSDCIKVLDLSGRVLFMNAPGRTLMELAEDQALTGLEWTSFWPPESIARVREALSVGRSGRSSRFTALCPTAAGTPKWWDVSVSSIPGSDGLPHRLLAVSRDITELKLAEERARRSQEEYARLYDQAAAGLMVVNVLADGSFAYQGLNPALERATGLKNSEIVGKRPHERLPPEAADEIVRNFQTCVRRGEPILFELTLERPAGRQTWVSTAAPVRGEHGIIDTLLITSREVTEARLAEAALRESEERFAQLFRRSTDALLIVRVDPDGAYRYEALNPVFARATGLDDRIIGKTPDDVLERDFAARVKARYDACLAADGPLDFDAAFHPAGGGEQDWSVTMVAERDASGRAIRIFASARDFTERRALEQRLHRSQRLEAMGQLTGGVAHDFNNLLTVIIGNAELLEESLSGSEELAELASMTRRAAERGAALTGGLLAFARRQALQPEAVDVGELLRGMVPLLRRTLGEHIQIDLRSADALPRAGADAAQLESAVLNLAINARDAMPDGGTLVLEAALAPDLGGDDHGGPGRVEITVKDTGSGMSPDVLAHALEPFFTTKEAGKGSGLGLSSVYGFVEQSGGRLAIESTPGAGTAVRIQLPLWGGGESANPVVESEPEASGARQRILLVEDDPMVRVHVRRMLERLGYEVEEAQTGPEALDLLNGRRFDLLFSDIVMPGGLNGREVVAAAQRQYPDLSCLLTSGYDENAGEASAVNGPPLLRKPYRRAQLASAISEALGLEPA